MFSTVSGRYFAGHLAVSSSAPPPGNSAMTFAFPGSGVTGSTTLTDLSGNGYNLSVPSGALTVNTSGSPAYAQLTQDATAVFPYTSPLTPSSTQQKTVSIWLRYFNDIWFAPESNIFTYNDNTNFSFDGIYLFARGSGTSKIETLHGTTNGQNIDDTKQVSVLLEKNTWYMITFRFIMNNTGTSALYVNQNRLLQWTHPSDSMIAGNYKVTLSALRTIGGQFNQFGLFTTGLTDADVAAKFASERGYYGV